MANEQELAALKAQVAAIERIHAQEGGEQGRTRVYRPCAGLQ